MTATALPERPSPTLDDDCLVFVDVNGIRLAYSDTGSGAPVVLLVHGFPLNRSMWDPQVGNLRAAGCRVIAPDLRGFGASEGADRGPLTMEQHADDLAALLEAVSVSEPVVYVGLSMGGYVGFAFWRRHRSRARAFVLADTRASADTPAGLFSPHLRTGAPVARQVLAMMSSNSYAAVANGARGLAARPDSFETVGTISVPTLVIVGEHDQLTPPRDSELIVGGIPGARLVTIDQAGHMSNMENPEAFNEVLTAFATDVRRAQ